MTIDSSRIVRAAAVMGGCYPRRESSVKRVRVDARGARNALGAGFNPHNRRPNFLRDKMSRPRRRENQISVEEGGHET